ncbi:hypothetical protein HanRHA438_Chr13g0582981 [Helianthus annuus]|nr:hypothetical protein HanRHA438_Chr13g0582981 [Helianthus annuus]
MQVAYQILNRYAWINRIRILCKYWVNYFITFNCFFFLENKTNDLLLDKITETLKHRQPHKLYNS